MGEGGWLYPSRYRQLSTTENHVIWTLIFFFLLLLGVKTVGAFWAVNGSRTQCCEVSRKPPWATLFIGGIYEGSSFTRWLYR